MTRARNHAGSAPHEGEAAPERRATPPRPTTACRLRLLTVNEVAELLQVSSKTARRWIELQELRTHRLGRQLRVSEEDLAAFLGQRRK